ncbi:MAG: YggT family protein [Candidatus Rokubacteria bacterium]|nr:YggT family protein [Candidatus Rokubacteria bacterium]
MLGYTIVGLVSELLQLYTYVIIAAALITWVSPDPRNPIVRFLHRVTEPVLRPVRELLPPWKTGGLDISPMIVLVAIQVVRWWILPLLY